MGYIYILYIMSNQICVYSVDGLLMCDVTEGFGSHVGEDHSGENHSGEDHSGEDQYDFLIPVMKESIVKNKSDDAAREDFNSKFSKFRESITNLKEDDIPGIVMALHNK